MDSLSLDLVVLLLVVKEPRFSLLAHFCYSPHRVRFQDFGRRSFGTVEFGIHFFLGGWLFRVQARATSYNVKVHVIDQRVV